MSGMRSALCLAVLAALVSMNHAHLGCTPNFCEIAICGNNMTCNDDQELRPNTTACNCCLGCVTKLGEGKRCRPMFVGSGSYLSECGPNLVCNSDDTCVPE